MVHDPAEIKTKKCTYSGIKAMGVDDGQSQPKLGQSGHTTARWKAHDKADSVRHLVVPIIAF